MIFQTMMLIDSILRRGIATNPVGQARQIVYSGDWHIVVTACNLLAGRFYDDTL